MWFKNQTERDLFMALIDMYNQGVRVLGADGFKYATCRHDLLNSPLQISDRSVKYTFNMMFHYTEQGNGISTMFFCVRSAYTDELSYLN